MITLRPYQTEISTQAADKLKQLGCVYLAMDVRTGKTLTALKAAELYGAKSVLFLTKLRAIQSIQKDYDALAPAFTIEIINNESMHKALGRYDLIISDEHHRLSAFPKPNKAFKFVLDNWGGLPMIFLSGTPAAESGSQWFHSFFVCRRGPWRGYRNFYGWAKEFVKLKIKHLGAIKVNDYSEALDDKIKPLIAPYLLTYTQEEAGFQSKITETVINYDICDKTVSIIEKLLKTNLVVGTTEQIIADTPVKLMTKIHQLEGGTIIFESGNSKVLDDSKARFIKQHFAGYKLAIFYYFKEEWQLLKQVFGDDLTNDLNEFNTSSKHIALQQVSGSEGISLKAADKLIYYSFGYSGKNYIQGRDRLTTIDRERNEVFFIFAKGSLSSRIYKAITNKKAYNKRTFIRDYERAGYTIENKEVV